MVDYTECAYQIQRERHDECVKTHKKYDSTTSTEQKEMEEAKDELNKAKAKKEFHES